MSEKEEEEDPMRNDSFGEDVGHRGKVAEEHTLVVCRTVYSTSIHTRLNWSRWHNLMPNLELYIGMKARIRIIIYSTVFYLIIVI